MSSSSSSAAIPNLSTVRGRGTRGRGRGGLRRAGNSGGAAPVNKDLPIQQTDQDASVARLSAVQTGYLEDEFAGCFVPAAGARAGGERRMPVINRGTYVRTTTLDHLLTLFLAASPPFQPSQIISLGAGSDTRFFRLLLQNPASKPTVIYHELDFRAITSQKVKTISQNPRLLSIIRGHAEAMGGDGEAQVEVEVDVENGSLYSGGYNIHPVDLRELATVQLRNVNPHIPTLIISECLLCYLPTPPTLLTHLTSTLIPSPTPLTMLIYEPLSPHPPTPFSLTMTSNLSLRNLSLTLLPSLRAQTDRLHTAGFANANAADVQFLWEKWTSPEEKRRVAALEMLDELEEWFLMARHYCVVWAWRDDPLLAASWAALPAQEGPV
ncbi:MAG: carboxy methyl transferase for protein phosphatase 2A [Geoglossum simile]|nr:MAG: carboxy methyl transferase for protein phosphatase 2A [Geoglossum simile]